MSLASALLLIAAVLPPAIAARIAAGEISGFTLELDLLRDALAEEETLAWKDSTHYSISIYDVPHKSIYGADAEKFGQFERCRESVGLGSSRPNSPMTVSRCCFASIRWFRATCTSCICRE